MQKLADFFDKFAFQTHGAKTVDLAVDIVIAVDQADVFDLGTDFKCTARSLEF